jgi:Flp pilus assembly protein TadG
MRGLQDHPSLARPANPIAGDPQGRKNPHGSFPFPEIVTYAWFKRNMGVRLWGHRLRSGEAYAGRLTRGFPDLGFCSQVREGERMIVKRCGIEGVKPRRQGTAAVEFAVCLPILFIILFGLWEVGRTVEVQNVAWNAAREGARDASMGQANLQAVANNLVLYLQSAEPSAFGQGHSTSLIAPVITLPANSYGYTCWDNTANCELFTMSFTDVTTPTVTDPTGMAQLDHYRITVSYPYTSIGWLPVTEVITSGRLYVAVDWASMVDSPFTIPPSLPAQ